MKLEEQVCSLELAKKLKELGIKQESLFWWVKGGIDYGYEGEWSIEESDNSWFIFDHVVNYKIDGDDLKLKIETWKDESDEEFIKWERRKKRANNKFLKENIISAFTVAELGELLPKGWHSTKPWNDYEQESKGKWVCILWGESGETKEAFYAKNEANARAKMLIYLSEKNLIK